MSLLLRQSPLVVLDLMAVQFMYRVYQETSFQSFCEFGIYVVFKIRDVTAYGDKHDQRTSSESEEAAVYCNRHCPKP